MNETLNKRFVWLPATIYMVVWLFCVGWFWLGMDGGGWIMAYTILAFMVSSFAGVDFSFGSAIYLNHLKSKMIRLLF